MEVMLAEAVEEVASVLPYALEHWLVVAVLMMMVVVAAEQGEVVLELRGVKVPLTVEEEVVPKE
jgi:hypothetical protein